MRYMLKQKIYKARNVTFCPRTMSAFSYGWWKFVGLVEGKLIFNNYRYSNSTSKHQSKVRRLLAELSIKIDIEMPVPQGLPGTYRHIYPLGTELAKQKDTLASLIQAAEEYLCDQYLEQQLKAQDRYQKSKRCKLERKLEDYLENQVHFRDYDIVNRSKFANPNEAIANKVAVHQVVDAATLERDVENALHNFHKDGFGLVVFYV